ncbi:MAG: hypothetical protein ACRERV_02320 [Methylococcales bacterium]
MKTDKALKLFRFRGLGGALLLLVFFLVGAFPVLSTTAFPEMLLGKDGWILFHEDQEGKYYYDENSVVSVADARSARYIGVYSAPKSHDFIYGFVAEAQASCGLLFNKFKLISLRTFGKGGPDDLTPYVGSAPPDDDFTWPKRESLAYFFVRAMCNTN